MSFLEYMLLFFVALPIVVIWGWCLVQIVARPDLRVWKKVLWIAAVILLPIIGLVAYFLTAARRGPVDDTDEWEDRSAEEIEKEVYLSTHATAVQRTDDLFRR
jgi:heme/copper-type cytochrome/quinol oxidase subunit 2